MKHINVRQLLREFNSLFPLPDEGLLVIRKEGDFFITPQPVKGTYVISNSTKGTTEKIISKISEQPVKTYNERFYSPVTGMCIHGKQRGGCDKCK